MNTSSVHLFYFSDSPGSHNKEIARRPATYWIAECWTTEQIERWEEAIRTSNTEESYRGFRASIGKYGKLAVLQSFLNQAWEDNENKLHALEEYRA